MQLPNGLDGAIDDVSKRRTRVLTLHFSTSRPSQPSVTTATPWGAVVGGQLRMLAGPRGFLEQSVATDGVSSTAWSSICRVPPKAAGHRLPHLGDQSFRRSTATDQRSIHRG